MNSSIGDRIKQIRLNAKLTQQEFADRLGLNRGTITNYEINRAIPMDSIFKLISKEFKVNLDWLKTGEGEPFYIPVPGDDEADLAEWVASICVDRDAAFQRRFLNALMKFTDQEWNALEILANKAKEILNEK